MSRVIKLLLANSSSLSCQMFSASERCVLDKFQKIQGQKSMAMAMFKRTFARTIPDNLRAPHMKMWGFEAKRARKFTRTSPRTLPRNSDYHAFCAPEKRLC